MGQYFRENVPKILPHVCGIHQMSCIKSFFTPFQLLKNFQEPFNIF